ncbi:MAG: DNA mismatch repair protein MutT [Pseudomonadota bacterium]
MTAPDPEQAPVVARPASTLVLLREGSGGAPEVLLGQRGGGAAFMPSKVVFPGGALDPEDAALAQALLEHASDAHPIDARLASALEADRDTGAPLPNTPEGPALTLTLALAAIRETYEETGLRIGRAGGASGLPPAAAEAIVAAMEPLGGSWAAFAADGAVPTPHALGFFFRAITPPYIPRRFDARFFAAHAADVIDDPEDFSGASGELSPLHWTPLSEASGYDLPFVTHLVIAEAQAMAVRCECAPAQAADGERSPLAGLAAMARGRPAPFFRHSAGAGDPEVRSRFEAL